MKKKYLLGVSVVALGLAMAPAAFADEVDLEDSLNGNGAGNDTQTDIDGNATNSPQTGAFNVGGDVGSGNETDIALESDQDGNGALNDTFQNNGTATNTPQTGAFNAGDDILSNNTLLDESEDNDQFLVDASDNTTAGSNSAAANDEGFAANDSMNDNGSDNGSNNTSNDGNRNRILSGNTNEDGNVAEGGEVAAAAQNDSIAVAIDDVDVLFDTDAVASSTEMSAANVLNVASANVAIADDDSDVSLSASADISGGPVDGVSLGQFSANAGSQGVTEQSQTVTANIGTGSF